MSDQIEGTARQGLGRAQDAAGALLGDTGLQARGKLNEAGGEAQRRYGEAKERALGAVNQAKDAGMERLADVEDFLRDQPLLGLAAGVGLGLVLASVLFGGRKAVYVSEKARRQ